MSLKLKEVMKELGVTAKDLAERMENNGTPFSAGSISRVINNSQSPKVSVLQDIADALDIAVIELFDTSKFETVYKKDEDGSYRRIGFIKLKK